MVLLGKCFRGICFEKIILNLFKGKEFPESDEIKEGVGREEDLKTPVGSKFFSPVP